MNNDTHITQLLADPDRRDEAFRLLMQRYGRSLYWHIRRIVVDHDDAEDALQDTAISVLAGLDNYRGDSELGTWLYRIATNQALLLLKRRKRWYQRLDDLGPALAERLPAADDINAGQAERLFQQAVLELPTQQRIAFNLRYYDELPYEKIAVITGKSVSTLKTNYHYAVTRIKNYIKQHAS